MTADHPSRAAGVRQPWLLDPAQFAGRCCLACCLTYPVVTADTAVSIVFVNSVVTVIEIGTETAVFRQNRAEPKPRFYTSLLAVSKMELL